MRGGVYLKKLQVLPGADTWGGARGTEAPTLRTFLYESFFYYVNFNSSLYVFEI